MDAAKISDPRVAFSGLSVLMMLGGLYQEELVQLYLLGALASMAGIILVPSAPAEKMTFWGYVYKFYIQTLVVPFAVLCTVLGISQMFPEPVSDTGEAIVHLSFTLWVCLSFIVFPPLGLRPVFEEWIEKKKGQRILRVLVVDHWIRITFEVFWIALVITLFVCSS